MRKLSNRKIIEICNGIIFNLEKRDRNNLNFLCLEFKQMFLNTGINPHQSEYKILIPMFTKENAVKYANANPKALIDEIWWCVQDDGTFNFDDRIKFMKWLKEQYTPKQTLIEKWFKKIFKFIPVLLLGVTLMTSCNDAMDVEKCYENVQKAYPNSKVLTTKDSEFTFIVVIDSNNVMLVRTLNLTNPKISSVNFFSNPF